MLGHFFIWKSETSVHQIYIFLFINNVGVFYFVWISILNLPKYTWEYFLSFALKLWNSYYIYIIVESGATDSLIPSIIPLMSVVTIWDNVFLTVCVWICVCVDMCALAGAECGRVWPWCYEEAVPTHHGGLIHNTSWPAPPYSSVHCACACVLR